jgi:cytochrome c-type biogenesis protein CcmH/NrfG
MVVVFAGGFVFLGVGSGGLDLGSLLRDSFGRGKSSGPSISKAQDKANKNPRDAAAQKALAKAYEDKGRIPEALATYQTYTSLRPKDVEALSHLGALQTQQANTYLQDAQIAFFEQSLASANSTFGVAADSKFGKALGTDPITNVVQTKASTAAQQANAQYSSAAQGAVATYKKLAKAEPTFENFQLLGTTAKQFQDTATALKAYKQALKHATDPVVKAEIRAEIKALQPAAGKGAGG